MSEFDDENIASPEVKKERDIDKIVFMKQTNTVEITTLVKYLNVAGETLRTEGGKNFIYKNYVNEKEEQVNDFNTFCQKLGLTMAAVKQAILEMEGA